VRAPRCARNFGGESKELRSDITRRMNLINRLNLLHLSKITQFHWNASYNRARIATRTQLNAILYTHLNERTRMRFASTLEFDTQATPQLGEQKYRL
jgi:hypothetical protein